MSNQTVAQTDNLNFVSETKRALKNVYLADGRPWVVAFSGGKDSTAVLHLVYEVLLDLGPSAIKPVFVISSDTQVEAPNISSYVSEIIEKVQGDANKRSLPLTCEIVRPDVSETFWSKLIGRGYPPPTRWFRWCTTNMKIRPSRRAIDKITAAHGSVILLLGSRTAESSIRKRGMESRVKNFQQLNAHHEIPNAFVLAPISSWTDDDVWDFLYSYNPPPWGYPHDKMISLYRQAIGGECPVVMDLNTPSCGGGRFGCWTCTVVKMDKSMEGFIQTGDEWMRPLSEFRNWLKQYRELESVRMKRRRDGSEGLGPFTPHARQEILSKLLECESKVDVHLIRDDEIEFIQRVWSSEFDLKDAAFALASEFGRNVERGKPMPLNDDEQTIDLPPGLGPRCG